MEVEKQELLQKEKHKVDFADKLRIIFLIIALLLLLFLFFGGKIWEGQAWFTNASSVLYIVMTYDVLLMLGCTFAKIYFISRYNKIIKTK